MARDTIRPEVETGPLVFTRRSFVAAAAAGAASVFAPAIIGRAQSVTTVRLGHTQPLTGPSAPYGIRAMDGARVAIAEIKAAGGFRDAKGNRYVFEMSEDDMANDPKQAVTLFRQQALDAKVVVSLGPTNSVGFIPLVPIAGQIKLPLIGNGSGAPVKQWNPFSFRVNPVASTAVPVVLGKVHQLHKFKRLALIYDQTQDGQVGDATVAREQQSKLGYELVANEAFRANDQDFSPQISKIKSAKPDALYVAAATGDGVKVVTQIRGAGLDLPMITGYGSFQDPVYWDGTMGGVKDGYTWLAQDLKTASGKLKEWLDAYNKQFKNEATSFSTYGYDSVYAVAEAIRVAASTDREKVRQALASLAFTSPIGTRITFKNPPAGENQTPSVAVIKVTGRGTYTAVA